MKNKLTTYVFVTFCFMATQIMAGQQKYLDCYEEAARLFGVAGAKQHIDADLASALYAFDNGKLAANVKVYGSDIEHGMNNYNLRQTPMANGMYRQNIAEGENRGFSFDIASGNWKAGIDWHSEIHNSNIDNINNPSFFVVNFNDAERDIIGAFIEHKYEFSNGLETELGLRANQVSMCSGIKPPPL